eukprot:3450038-Ditylum_brightwellii.AAC.1
MDEDSMAGRPLWAWFEHRSVEARSFGDHFQLLPVGMKGIHSLKPANDANGSDSIGRLAFENYLHSNEESGIKSLAVLIYEVVRQQDPLFFNVLDAMTNGKI